MPTLDKIQKFLCESTLQQSSSTAPEWSYGRITLYNFRKKMVSSSVSDLPTMTTHVNAMTL